MKTLGDFIKELYTNYLAPTDEKNIGKKERQLQNSPNAPPEHKNEFGFLKAPLTMEQCRQTALQTPMFMKAARKKAMDSIRAWHKILTLDEKTNPISKDLEIIETFERRSQLRWNWYNARVASYVYGDGYLLITFENDEDTMIFDSPAEDSIPYKVSILNSEYITKIDFYPNRQEFYKKLGIRHFHYENKETGEDFWIHPDRIIHIPCDSLPHRQFGNSKINLLRNVIKSMVNVDISAGETLAWFAHGQVDIAEDGLEPNKRNEWEKVANKHPSAWIHDRETSEIKSIDPKAIDPKPFYDYLILKVAAAFQMPEHVLKGVQVGRVTGAEAGFSDYVKDIRDDQDLIYNPKLELLYERLLKGNGRKWKYKISWNTIYVDEMAEAEIMEKRVNAAEKALNGARGVGGFIDKEEARLMYNKGQIQLDTNKKIKDRQPIQQKPQKPKDDDEDDEKEEGLYKAQLDTVAKAMIRRRKEIAARERKLGDEILREQGKHGDNN